METKLQSMDGYKAVEEDQDGLELIKLLQKAYFEQESTKQTILKIVEADKRLMICWQRPGMSINSYTRIFKMCIEVCEAVGRGIGASGPSTKLACETAGLDYNALKISLNGKMILKLKKNEKSGRSLYFASLHFEGFNKCRYSAL